MMTVAELRKRLGRWPSDTPVYIQDLADNLLTVHPCLGEADEGNAVVIMARAAKSAQPLPGEDKR